MLSPSLTVRDPEPTKTRGILWGREIKVADDALVVVVKRSNLQNE